MVGKCTFCKDINTLAEVLIRCYLRHLIDLFRRGKIKFSTLFYRKLNLSKDLETIFKTYIKFHYSLLSCLLTEGNALVRLFGGKLQN